MAFDFRKEYKEFYMPKNRPEIVNVHVTDTTDTTDDCLPKPGLYPMGEPLVADLNGDGKKEELRVEILPSEHEYQDEQISVTINGTNYTRVVEEAYGEKEKSASIGVLTPQKVRITATDNEHWCYLEGEDGTVGWFYVDGSLFLPRRKGRQRFGTTCRCLIYRWLLRI